MLGRYKGPIILREPVPHNPLHKRYPQKRNKYGVLLSDHRVTLEEELLEIRTRHVLRREYNRQKCARWRAMQKAKQNVSADNRAVDEPHT